MPPEIKFCGMTRGEDVDAAVAAGGRYVGVIFADGPRRVSVPHAQALLGRVPEGVGRVGVFGADVQPAAVADVARAVRLDVVQLHGDPDAAGVDAVRGVFQGQVWAAVRVRGNELPPSASTLFETADAVVVDAYSAGALGGTGIALPWRALAAALEAARGPARLVLAGGLRASTVADAIRALRPDVVDVSSGVESAPGIKDPEQLRAFRDAVHGEGVGP